MGLLLDLFLTFAKVGLFTFGGGYAMIALIENTCVENKAWITHDEMMDVTVIAESTPGPIAINCATYVGSSQAGLLGALIATTAVILPSFVIILVIMVLLKKILKNPRVQAVLRGLKPCIIGIILATGAYMILTHCFTSLNDFSVDLTATIMTIGLALVYFGSRKVMKKGISPIGLIGISAVAGIIVYTF